MGRVSVDEVRSVRFRFECEVLGYHARKQARFVAAQRAGRRFKDLAADV